MRTGKARLIEQLEDLLYDYEYGGEGFQSKCSIVDKWADRIMFDINHDIISKETDEPTTAP